MSAELIVHPSWDGTFAGGHDLALVRLTTALGGIAPAPLARGPRAAADVGQPLTIIGYGVTSGSDVANQTAGTRRSASTVASSVSAAPPLVEYGSATATDCWGDDGGPVLATVSGVEQVVAVCSYGSMACNGASGGVDVGAERAFIDAHLPAQGTSGSESKGGCGTSGAGTMSLGILVAALAASWRSRRRSTRATAPR
jgi:hypothetical protein